MEINTKLAQLGRNTSPQGSPVNPVRSWCDRYGSHVSADTAWLAMRGLRTLAIRMQRHQSSTLQVAKWLTRQKQIKKVLYPPLFKGDQGLLWQQQFSGSAGPFTIELQSCSEAAFEHFINALALFGLGTSWGGFESLVMPAIPHHQRSQVSMPDEARLVRLHIGLEQPEELCDNLLQALQFISA